MSIPDPAQGAGRQPSRQPRRQPSRQQRRLDRKPRRLDRKLDAIGAGRYTPGDFVIADAKDADMAFGLTSAGPAGSGRHRTRGAFLDDMRALVAQGELDIM